MERGGREKSSYLEGGEKKREKKYKKELTRGGGRGNIFERSRKGPTREGRRGRGNLENDTERLEETTVNSEMSFA